uniref:Uncharacterized protein n=1 Tax=Glossina palpalis gambiensis TaxID=67801 RepID=A0A1B0BG81_9MUSC
MNALLEIVQKSDDRKYFQIFLKKNVLWVVAELISGLTGISATTCTVMLCLAAAVSWIQASEIKVKKLPTSFLSKDKCRFLSNFSQKTAEVELPGEFLIPSSPHYHIRISRFMLRVEIVQKNNNAARRLHIRRTNDALED